MTEAKSEANRSVERESVFDALVHEVAAKLEAAQPIDLDAIAVEHPDYIDRLRILLPTLQAMAELAHSHADLLAASPESIQPGEPKTGILGDFRVLREIGRGGMGVVYEAQQISLDRKVALKILPFAGILDRRQLQRFQNEARAAAGLHHPNIVPVYSVGCERAVHFYAMQYVEGQTLARVIDELQQLQTMEEDERDSDSVSRPTHFLVTGRPRAAPERPRPSGGGVPSSETNGKARAEDTEPQPRAQLSAKGAVRRPEFFRSVARLGIQAAQALEYAHQSGVVHRDIKPSNLLIDLDGNLWISDFGLAQTRAGPNITMTGDVVGTLRYMSPEQAEGNRRVLDHHTDIYSLGVTLYETLTLHPPFEAADRHQLIHQIIDGDHQPPRQPRHPARLGDHCLEGHGDSARNAVRHGPGTGRRPAAIPRRQADRRSPSHMA